MKPEDKKENWVVSGLIWGGIMFAAMTIIFPFVTDGKITLESFLIGILFWGLAGLLYGYITQWTKKRIKKRNS